VTQELKNGLVSVTLHLDPERESEPFADLPELTTLHGTPGSAPLVDKRDFRWTSADTLEVEMPLRGGETSLSTLDIAGAGRRTLAPVCLPYSPEFKPVEPDAGLLALDRLARATNGKERANLAGVWREMPARPRLFEMSPWLLSMALVLFLLEVLQRRTALLSSGPGFITVARKSAAATVRPVSLLFPAMKRRRFRRVSGASEVADKNRLAGEDRPGRSAIEASNALRRQVENSRLDGSDGEVRAASTTSGGNNEPSSASAPDQGVVDALRRARSRASKRTRQP
jgi:hypothetical protein